MDKEKQIEEMAKEICAKCKSDTECEKILCTMAYREAEYLVSIGYRKASEVARNIIAEIDEKLNDMAVEYHNAGHPLYYAVCEMVHHKVIAPIEKKYTEEGK